MHSCCSQNTILVDGVELHSDDTIVIKDGSQIIPGTDRRRSESFNIINKIYGIENCKIVLYVYHSVVTVP